MTLAFSVLPVIPFWDLIAQVMIAASTPRGLWEMLFGSLAIMWPTTVIHEAGHYYAARIAGAAPTLYKLGSGPPALSWKINPACTFAIAIFPASGLVCWQSPAEILPGTRAFIAASGWMMDVATTGIIAGALSLTSSPTLIGSAIWYATVFRVAVGLTPVTSDGRQVAVQAWLMTNGAIARRLRRPSPKVVGVNRHVPPKLPGSPTNKH